MKGGWISTWKKIALYCDRHINTVKKWHKRYGMPVYRLPPGYVPVIFPEQVDQWLMSYNLILELRAKKKISCSGFSCLRFVGFNQEILSAYLTEK